MCIYVSKKKNHYERGIMKKLLLLLIIGVSTAYAQNEKLNIYTKDSPNPTQFEINKIANIVFSDVNMVVNTIEAEETPISISSIKRINFLPVSLDIDVYFHMHDGSIVTYKTKEFDDLIFLQVIKSVKDNGAAYPGEVTITKGTPNPFTEKTKIEFLLEKPGIVEATITDMNGNVLSKLYNGDLDKGTHSVTWDGAGRDGARVSSGAYICSVRLNNIVVSKKLIFVN